MIARFGVLVERAILGKRASNIGHFGRASNIGVWRILLARRASNIGKTEILLARPNHQYCSLVCSSSERASNHFQHPKLFSAFKVKNVKKLCYPKISSTYATHILYFCTHPEHHFGIKMGGWWIGKTHRCLLTASFIRAWCLWKGAKTVCISPRPWRDTAV